MPRATNSVIWYTVVTRGDYYEIKNYQTTTYKTIKEIKLYLLELTKESNNQGIYDIMNTSVDVRMWKKNISMNQDAYNQLFYLLKQKIKSCENEMELENAIVFMNILLPETKQLAYKWQLFEQLMKYKQKDIYLYCLIRHLIYKSQQRTEEIIQLLATSNNIKPTQHHILALQIYCLENEHAKAYNHVCLLPLEEIQEYKEELITKHPWLYRKLIFQAKRRKTINS